MRANDLLLVVDVQNDFLPGGALAVPQGDEIVAPIVALADRFAHVVLTQDWHPGDHVSFAACHPGRRPLDSVELPDGRVQVLWPVHCVQGTRGADFAPALRLPQAELIVRKGYGVELDSYSAFVEADRRTKTGLAGYLHERGIRRLFIVGLATDFCVGWTAIDACAAGFETYVVEDLCRAIDTGGSLAKARTDMAAAGVKTIASADVR